MKRRLFLKGVAGAAVAAPFLGSLQRPAQAQAATAPRRLVIFYTNNGCIVPKWGPSVTDGAIESAALMGTTLEPVASHAKKLLFPRGLAMFPRGQINGYFDPHDQGMGSKLTAAPIDPAGSHWATSRSLDHVAAELINPAKNGPLVLSVGSAFANVKGIVSYSAAQTPYTPETKPANVYNSLTGAFVGGAPVTETDYRVKQGNSIIDLVKGDLDTLKRLNMSGADKKKLDDWLALLRQTEVQVVASAACNAETATQLGITDSTVKAAAARDTATAFMQGGDMMIKLIALTMMCDTNRSIILQWPGFVTFNFDGIAHQYDHHGLSHRNGTNAVGGDPLPGVEDMIWEIDRWYGKRYGKLVSLIDSISEGDGTMLDNSAVMWLPELCDGAQHNNDKLPIVIAGGAGGYLKQGVSVTLAAASSGGGASAGPFGSGGVPLNKLHTTLLNAVGSNIAGWIPVTSFGTMDNNKAETINDPGELTPLKAS